MMLSVPDALCPGRTFAGRWRIGDAIARGTHSIVLEATFAQKQQPKAAIKLVVSDDTVATAALMTEAALLNRLPHPCLPASWPACIDAGWLGLPLERINGPSLAQALRDGQAGRDLAARITPPITAALAHLHGAGIVHGDIKPGNILLCPTTGARLIDLGAARQAGRHVATPTELTPAYCCPERLAGAVPDCADDVFGLACLIWICLAGQRMAADRQRIVTTANALLPPSEAALLIRALSPVRRDRPGLLQFSDAIVAVLRRTEPHSTMTQMNL